MRTLYLLLMVAVLAIFGCSSSGGTRGNSPAKALTSIQVQPANNQVAIGGVTQFKVIGNYSDNSTQELTSPAVWTSSDPSVASITADGKATAKAAGATTITAKVGDMTASTVLTVQGSVKITITPAQPAMAAGTSLQLAASAMKSDSSTVNVTATATWSSDNTSVCTVAAGGVVTAVAAGQANITATQDGVSGKTTVTVTNATLQSVSVTPSNPTIVLGTGRQMTATGLFSDNTQQELTRWVSWTSSNPAVATVAVNGAVTAVAAGTTTITATSPLGGSVSGSTLLTVSSASLQSIAIQSADAAISAGATRQLTATGFFSDGSSQDLTPFVAWSSSDNGIATISPAGVVTAEAPGTALISASMGGISSSKTMTVTPAAVAGRWLGTYTITDSTYFPEEVGIPYRFEFVLGQNGDSLSGNAFLRDNAEKATSISLTGTVSGRTINFAFTYNSPRFGTVEEDVGSAAITDAAMTGTAIENRSQGYNLSYVFQLTRQP